MPRTASLRIFLEGRGSGTLQEQIYRSIRQWILDGRVSGGHRLQSTRALAKDLLVSRTTVLLALEQLRAEGYLVARRGSGIYVASRLPAIPHPPVKPPGAAHAPPPFSRRGQILARTPAPDCRQPSSTACAFRLGTPALDLFPRRVWSKLTRDCLRTLDPRRLDYAPLAGLPELRVAIAELVQSRGTSCSAGQVQVVTGAQRGLDFVSHMLLDPGDEAWMEDPGYPGARGALNAAGARIVPVPVDAEGMNIGGRETHSARLAYVTPSCQFPLGVALSLARRHKLLEWARRMGAWVLEDDYDCDTRYLTQPLPCLHALDPDGRVIYVGTFSKSLFPSLRLGFLIVPRELAEGFVTARLATDLHPPVLEQRVLAAFITGGHYHRHVRRMQAAYEERLDALRRAIDRVGLPLRLRPVHAGMHAVVDIDGPSAERVHQEAIAFGIESMPMSAYCTGPAQPSNALVLGFGSVPPPSIRVGVTKLARAVERSRFPADH